MRHAFDEGKVSSATIPKQTTTFLQVRMTYCCLNSNQFYKYNFFQNCLHMFKVNNWYVIHFTKLKLKMFIGISANSIANGHLQDTHLSLTRRVATWSC